jgi:hypothetical protein
MECSRRQNHAGCLFRQKLRSRKCRRREFSKCSSQYFRSIFGSFSGNRRFRCRGPTWVMPFSGAKKPLPGVEALGRLRRWAFLFFFFLQSVPRRCPIHHLLRRIMEPSSIASASSSSTDAPTLHPGTEVALIPLGTNEGDVVTATVEGPISRGREAQVFRCAYMKFQS